MFKNFFTIIFFLFLTFIIHGEDNLIKKELDDRIISICEETVPPGFTSRLVSKMEKEKIPLSTLTFIIRNFPEDLNTLSLKELEDLIVNVARETDLLMRKGEAPGRIKLILNQYLTRYRKGLNKEEGLKEHLEKSKWSRVRNRQRGNGKYNGGSGNFQNGQGNGPQNPGAQGNGPQNPGAQGNGPQNPGAQGNGPQNPGAQGNGGKDSSENK